MIGDALVSEVSRARSSTFVPRIIAPARRARSWRYGWEP